MVPEARKVVERAQELIGDLVGDVLGAGLRAHRRQLPTYAVLEVGWRGGLGLRAAPIQDLQRLDAPGGLQDARQTPG